MRKKVTKFKYIEKPSLEVDKDIKDCNYMNEVQGFIKNTNLEVNISEQNYISYLFALGLGGPSVDLRKTL